MLNLFFYETVNKYEETVYRLNTAGYVFFIALGLICLCLALALSKKKSVVFSTKQLVFSAVAISLATVLSEVKLFQAPMGGSVTLFSMLFVVLIGWIYGPSIGLLTGLTHGILQLILGSSIYSLPQMIVDYPLAFAALGLSGFFCDADRGLLKGYLLGAFGRFIFAFLSGFLFFAYYAPEGMNLIVYSALYNISYIGIEAAITCVVLLLPPVDKAMKEIKKMALS